MTYVLYTVNLSGYHILYCKRLATTAALFYSALSSGNPVSFPPLLTTTSTLDPQYTPSSQNNPICKEKGSVKVKSWDN